MAAKLEATNHRWNWRLLVQALEVERPGLVKHLCLIKTKLVHSTWLFPSRYLPKSERHHTTSQ